MLFQKTAIFGTIGINLFVNNKYFFVTIGICAIRVEMVLLPRSIRHAAEFSSIVLQTLEIYLNFILFQLLYNKNIVSMVESVNMITYSRKCKSFYLIIRIFSVVLINTNTGRHPVNHLLFGCRAFIFLRASSQLLSR